MNRLRSLQLAAVNPELASLLRRLKTIYAICGGELPSTGGGKKDDFHTKKSVLIAQLHNFDKVSGGGGGGVSNGTFVSALTGGSAAPRRIGTHSPPEQQRHGRSIPRGCLCVTESGWVFFQLSHHCR